MARRDKVSKLAIYSFDSRGVAFPAGAATAPDSSGRPPVLLVHGQPGSGSFWGPLPRALFRIGQIYSYDRPGWGKNDAEVGGLGLNVEHLDDVVATFGERPPILLGYSYGAAVVLDWIAQRAPGRVKALLVSPAANPLAYGPMDRLFEIELVGSAISVLASGTLRRALRSSAHARIRYARSLLAESNSLFADLSKVRASLPGDATIAIVSGLLDRVVTPRSVATLSKELNLCYVSWCVDAGHLLVWTNPDVIAAALTRLIDGIVPPGAENFPEIKRN